MCCQTILTAARSSPASPVLVTPMQWNDDTSIDTGNVDDKKSRESIDNGRVDGERTRHC